MLKSDEVTTAPAPLRDLGDAKWADNAAFAFGVTLFALFLGAALYLSTTVFEPRMDALKHAAAEAAQTVARAVADDFATAIGYGIPIDKMRGVGSYLEGTLADRGLVAGVVILDNDHKVLFHAPAVIPDPALAPRAPIEVGDKVAGEVLVVPSPQIVERARARLKAAAIASALVTAVLIAVLFRLFVLEAHNLPKARLAVGAAATARGVLGDFTPPPKGPLRHLGRTAAHRLAPIRRQHRRLMALSEEVRALDTSRALGERIDAAMAPVAAFRFDRPHKVAPKLSGRLWWPLLALTALVAARPLVASFAADRVGSGHLAALIIAATLAAHTIGALFGLLAATYGPARGAKGVSALGMIFAGAALGATLLIRDPAHFVAAQGLAGFFGALAIAAALQTEGARLREPWRTALVFLAALAIGLPLGALFAEAEGRRLAFATVGTVCAIAGLLAFAGHKRRRRRRPRRSPVKTSDVAALIATGAALVAIFDFEISAVSMRENYAGLALSAAILGAVSILPAIAKRGRTPIAASLGAAIATLALLAGLAGVHPYGVAALIGLALGITTSGIMAPSKVGGRVVVWVLVGALLAAATEALGVVINVPGLALTALCAAVLTALSFARTDERQG